MNLANFNLQNGVYRTSPEFQILEFVFNFSDKKYVHISGF